MEGGGQLKPESSPNLVKHSRDRTFSLNGTTTKLGTRIPHIKTYNTKKNIDIGSQISEFSQNLHTKVLISIKVQFVQEVIQD